VLVHVIAVNVVKMAVVKKIHVAVVLHCGVTAPGSVRVRVPLVLLTLSHDVVPFVFRAEIADQLSPASPAEKSTSDASLKCCARLHSGAGTFVAREGRSVRHVENFASGACAVRIGVCSVKRLTICDGDLRRIMGL
jgi:hypothetical protein